MVKGASASGCISVNALNYENPNFTITRDRLECSASGKYPYEFLLRKTTNNRGEKVIVGFIKNYKLDANGNLKLAHHFKNITVYI